MEHTIQNLHYKWLYTNDGWKIHLINLPFNFPGDEWSYIRYIGGDLLITKVLGTRPISCEKDDRTT